ncbi:hypothetical protein GLOIN_2v1774372 [Rhizophagus irregularis DAOM 181602=DAOM 197198]|uniref:F-box domain-containing protein n=1 Tax=Rhizophagus irregularis (strain DAOM 181602 / DAOM 197198 / MUCL 43194) TaxID=747089 RepID=A0A2P4Q2E4_RHIID|nr:hypothetical protein GLOIN_2v1774372 [Rhizophagus irregularis DAOM 181602=DAOM 197198]POG71827.1 hypothetical protein GLOIN_2v1774372 [Rhizophagus irregularis DAOM 181602=DAOM 197198]|eukprot:XP_025178693.1 hypothetical protein GLOIN_2v1774372 [Rhizophagus irregularis DAOM 181602=DAOM 197198]
MACSKIFSGDLPELTNEIIQYFRKDFSTLYSCILINRLWCRLAIPLLWEDPFPKKYLFSKIHPTNYHFIEIYLSKLNEDIKTKLYEYGVNNNLIISNTLLFNYPSFIKYLNIDKILNSVQTWVYTVVGKNQELVNLIYGSLLEMFIENEGNLHSFEVILPICYDVNYFNKSIDLILQNPNLTHNIRNLTFRIYNYNNQNIIKLLKFLYSNCNSISSMALDFPNYGDDYSLISEKCLTQIYISQNNLKKISFGSFVNLYNPFLTLKNSNCSNTLNTIIFYFIDFKNIISILQEVFDQLNVLESIHILYCNSLNSDFVQQIIKVNNPFKLRSLFINKILHFESLQLLLQKFSDCLENFGFASMMFNEYNEPKRQLFEFITKYCKNIRYFESGIPDDNIIYLFIENNQNNINYLTIEANTYNTDYEELSSIVLQNLGQVLPSKLEYLCLSLSFTISDLEIFLKNSQNTFIKKLLISDIVGRLDNEFLFTLRNEVNEFKLHNIIVKEFHDLHSSPYIFIDNYF